MSKTIILRFRDLVTEEGGTIKEHMGLIREYGEVWWGWWMRQYENAPYTLLQELSAFIKKEGLFIGYLFDIGSTRLYSASITKILVAPQGSTVGTPDPKRSPSYYHRGRYPAWFLLHSITEVSIQDLNLIYDSFPTKPELEEGAINLLGQRVTSLDQLRHIGVTLYVVQDMSE
jgi:hypothetical protein